jgi:predicted permease
MRATRCDLTQALKDTGLALGSERRGKPLRNILVIVQIAMSVLLLIAAGLFLRSLQKAYAVDPGFDAENVLVMKIGLSDQGFSEAQGKALYRQLTERVASMAGVQSASLASSAPFGEDITQTSAVIQGKPAPGEFGSPIYYNVVTPGYFSTMGVALVRGRDFTDRDTETAPPAVIINQSAARMFWPGEDPIGKRMRLGNSAERPYLDIIAIARDGKYLNLYEKPLPYAYVSLFQRYEGEMTLHVRSAKPEAMAPAIRDEIQALGSRAVLLDAGMLRDHINASLFAQRRAGSVTAVFGSLALLLAGVGLYGVIAYSVSRRTREIGIRTALGAKQGDLLKMVIREGMVLAGVGIGIGLGAAFALTRLIATFLPGVGVTDPVTFGGVSVLVMLVALAASYVPARRAASVDPMVALRHE